MDGLMDVLFLGVCFVDWYWRSIFLCWKDMMTSLVCVVWGSGDSVEMVR